MMNCLSCFRTPCSWIPQRYFMSIYILLGLNFFYWIRVAVNLAIVEMTFPIPSNHTTSHDCPKGEGPGAENMTKAEFSWSASKQQLILQGFYYGYIVTNVPGGVLADMIGGKSVFGYGILVSAIVSLLLPSLAKISPYCFFVGRILQGASQGMVLPSLSSLIAKWAPPNERATMSGITQSGVMFGNASGFLFASFVLAVSPGWEHVYYITGAIGIVWALGWYFLCYSSPATHPFISEKEKNMIESQIGFGGRKKPKHIPWKSILTSCPLWVAILANYGHLWAIFTMINEMPIYLKKVIHFSTAHSGIFSATPHLSMVPTVLLTGYLCDWLVKKNIMSTTINRKVFIFLSSFLPVPFMMAASFAGCSKFWLVVLFALMMFFKGLSYATLKVQPVDLSPHYAGTLMGLVNGTGAISGFVSPMVVPLFITGDGNILEWRRFFALSGCIMIGFTLPFLCFGSANVQPWDSNTDSTEDNTSGTKESSEND